MLIRIDKFIQAVFVEKSLSQNLNSICRELVIFYCDPTCRFYTINSSI